MLAYGTSAFIGVTQSHATDVDHGYYRSLLVPVAGPFVTLASGKLRGDEQLTIPALGVAQVAGLALAAVGIALPGARSADGTRSVAVAPVGPAGAGVVGTF